MIKAKKNNQNMEDGKNGASRNEKFILSESTPIKISLIAAFLGAFGLGVWWASSISSKLDSVISFQTSTTSVITELKAQDMSLIKEIGDMKLKSAITDVTIKSLQDKIGDNSISKK